MTAPGLLTLPFGGKTSRALYSMPLKASHCRMGSYGAILEQMFKSIVSARWDVEIKQLGP
jgi:hypothetical protein